MRTPPTLLIPPACAKAASSSPDKMLEPDVTIGMSFAGALTPAGLGCSSIVPLIKAGFVDWIVATGAILYHDLHFAFNLPRARRQPSSSSTTPNCATTTSSAYYDVLLGYSDCLMATDEILRNILIQPEFQKEMGTAELHYLIGRYAAEWERKAGLKDVSVLAAAYRAGVPCYTSSPGDSTIGMNVAGVELRGNKLRLNPSIDVNETTAIVLGAKRSGGKSGVMLMGGGSPKNFMLQTEPQIQEVLRMREYGQDYFFQITDARPTPAAFPAPPQRSGQLGQGGPGPPARRRGLLHRHDHRAAHYHALRAGPPPQTPAPAPLRPAAQVGQGLDKRVFRPQQGEDD
jgi:deoxyhypusine synthase